VPPAPALSVPAWSAHGYAANTRFVADLGAPLLALLDARPGERVLDLGCGDGALTARIAATGATVTGLGSSPALVAAARALGLDARLGDGQRLADALGREPPFDAILTNAALHWMPDANAVIRGMGHVLCLGGRVVGEFGGHGNVAAIVTALHAGLRARGLLRPATFRWFFPTAEAYAACLARNGLVPHAVTLTPRPTVLPTGLAGWLATFAAPFLRDVADPDTLLAETEVLLAPILRDEAGRWTADYVRLRFTATRP